MNTFNKQQYLMDGSPITPRELIKAAEKIDDNFKAGFLKSTSEAAHILREQGHTVDNNPDFRPQDA